MEMPHWKLLPGQKQRQQHKHNCPLCEQSFSRLDELQDHMRTHTATGGECESAGDVMHNVDGNPNSHRIEHRRRSSAAADDDDVAPSTSSPSSSQSRENGRARLNPNPDGGTPPADPLAEEEGLAHFLVTLSAHEQSARAANSEDSSPPADRAVYGGGRRRARPMMPPLQPPVPTLTAPSPRGLFVCSNCGKAFNSHQALGGHRASHKRVMGCFAARNQIASAETSSARIVEDARIAVPAENRVLSIFPAAEVSPETLPQSKPKVHECSICGRRFPSGQALGGHMRCHWRTPNSRTSAAAGASAVAANAEPATDAAEAGSGSHEVTEIEPRTPTPANEAAEMPLMLDGSADIEENRANGKATAASSNNGDGKRKATSEAGDDEAESREVKVARLIDVIEMGEGEESSTWLQLGIGSMADQQGPADRAA